MLSRNYLLLLFAFVLTGNFAAAQNLPSYLPANGLVGWWPFNGNAQDESGNGNHGDASTAILSSDRNGIPNSAYDFDGSGSAITIPPSNVLNITENITISFWLNPADWPQEGPAGCFVAMSTSDGTDQYYVGRGNGKLYSTYFNQGQFDRIDTYSEWTTNTWYHAAVVFDIPSNEIRFYINGNFSSAIANNFNPIITTDNAQLRFGINTGEDYHYYGSLDDIAIWNRALSQQEITQIYQASNETSLSYQLTQEKLGNCANSLVKLSVTTRPRIKTDSAIVTGSTTATAYGKIGNDGGKTLTRRGFCWSTSANPDLSNSFSENGSGSGAFSASLSGLSPSTTYHLRPYAGTATEVWYGNDITFSTAGGSSSSATCGTPNIHNPNLSYGTMTDQDGNSYKTIVIGNQEWMAENLKTGHYRNGDAIPNVTDSLAWDTLVTGAFVWFNNDSIEYDCPFGKLYNWYAVSDPRELCPMGWHIPSDSEMIFLANQFGGTELAGHILMSSSNLGIGASGGTNESGFSGLYGGGRFPSEVATVDMPGFIGGASYWWANAEVGNQNVNFMVNPWEDRIRSLNSYSKRTGFSVRCIKD